MDSEHINFCTRCGTKLTPEIRITINGLETVCRDCYNIIKPKVVYIDFDGVVAIYDGWRGPEILGEPMEGVEEFFKESPTIRFQNCHILNQRSRCHQELVNCF